MQGQSFDDLFRPILMHYINSASMVQQFLSSVIVEEWARQHDAERSNPLIETCPLARDLAGKILAWLQGDPPVAYHEMVMLLSRLHGECYNLLHSFVSDCKLPASAIPSLGKELDPTGTSFTSFTIHTAKAAVGDLFEGLKTRLGRTKKKEVSVLDERRKVVAGSIDRYFETKTEFDVRVSAGFAAAFIALRGTPDKVSPIVKGIMNGVKVRSTCLPVATRRLTRHCRTRRMLTFKLVRRRRSPPSLASAPSTNSASRLRRS
jgi:TATA-binding protein-associated factor